MTASPRKAAAPRRRAVAAAPKPQPAKPKNSTQAREAEVDGYLDIEQCGITLRIPLGDNVPLAAYLAFKAGEEHRGVQLLLGPEQWAAFLEKNPTVGDFDQIGQKIYDLVGN